MEETFIVTSPQNANIVMAVTPGHFTTNSSHVSHYLDLRTLKYSAVAAADVARELAAPYISCEEIDTIVCMEGTEIIGAYLAEELMQEGPLVINSDEDIYVVRPMSNLNGQFVFQNSERAVIKSKNVILLVSSVSSGKTVYRALDFLSYYGGNLIGISALFAAVPNIGEHEIHTVFTDEDIPNYRFYRAGDCALCEEGRKLDGIANYGGYTEL